MKTTLFALSVLSLSLGSTAVAQNTNLSDNQPYYVISSGTHPVTGQNRNWGPSQPPEFSNGVGCPAGLKTFKVYQNHLTHRGPSDPYDVSGYTFVFKLAASTPAGGAGIGRLPAMEIRDIVPDPNSAGDFMPGPNQWHAIAASPSAATGLVNWVNNTFPAVSLPGDFCSAGGSGFGYCLTYDFAGGEETNTPATAAQPSQVIVGTWQCGDTYDPTDDGAVVEEP